MVSGIEEKLSHGEVVNRLRSERKFAYVEKHEDGFPHCTSIAIGKVPRDGDHLKGRLKHRSIYRRVP